MVKRREGEDEEEDKQEEAPMGEGDAAAQHPDSSPETDDLPTSPGTYGMAFLPSRPWLRAKEAAGARQALMTPAVRSGVV